MHFFLNGGPSQVDTFDPKPALEKFAGKPLPQSFTTERKTGSAFPSSFKFSKHGQSGIEVSELFPRVAEHVDDIAVIRSMFAQIPSHEPSLMLMNCGDSVQSRPSVGSWVLYGLGTENQNLPGFIAMSPNGYPVSDNANWRSAFLPGTYQGTFIDPQYQQVDRLIENITSPHASTGMQRQQLDYLQQFNLEHAASRLDPRLESRIQSFELAFRMQTEAADAFDVSGEPEHIHQLYGSTMHGRQTLMARRLLERGVRYVQLWHGAGQPWDHHKDIATKIRETARDIDQPIAALLTDLKQRGMLEDTLVICGGEFGRTPVSESDSGATTTLMVLPYGWRAAAYGAARSMARRTISVSKPVQNPTSVHDLHATILHLLGFDHERLTYRYAGRNFRLTDVSGEVVRDILA